MKRQKLRQRIQQGRKSVRFEDLCRLLEAYGWELDRTKGSHHVYKRGSQTRTVPFKRPTVLPVYVDQVLALLEADDDEGNDDDGDDEAEE